ncbi:hypothetical protein [Algoriphagus sp. NG3]|uniref:hypothetical protein n=1 Tax=Algoriphagus sp. NG3 TaxID=3097546 RepID=UPI002A821CF8|nr:hypothetical protein [Algoriphagus sp. NG3]WPR73950.1 hypothetical protein SLW71_14845 [Algoriphagus sp. NG3]
MRLLYKLLVVFSVSLLVVQDALCQSHGNEKIGFSIPKTIYFGGERIWISSQATLNDSPTESKIIYAELVNRYNESVAVAKMPLENGRSFNFLQLPVNLPSDHYLLRVFTRVSPYQNLEEGLVQQFVTVFNRTVPPAVVPERKLATTPTANSDALLSQQVVRTGDNLTVNLPAGEEVTEISVAAGNPFLMTQGIISSSAAYESIDQHKLVPELFGHIVEAKVERASVDTAQLYYLSLHGDKSALFTDRPDAEGSMYFDAGGMKHWEFLVAQANSNKSLLDFQIVSPAPVTHFKNSFVFPELEITPADQELLENLLKGGQVEGYFVNEFDSSMFPVVTGFTVDRTYLLDDYTRFESVTTVIKEYVPEVRQRTIKKKKEFRVLDEVLDAGFDSNPLMLIDALPVFDSDMLAAFDPAGFEKLEILMRTFFLNEEKFPGVIAFSSYNNDFGGFPIPSNGIYLDYQGIQPRIASAEYLFEAPKATQKIMDWRTVLYWSETQDAPSKTASLEIKTPDLKGRFHVKVKTVTPTGDINEYYQAFEVN